MVENTEISIPELVVNQLNPIQLNVLKVLSKHSSVGKTMGLIIKDIKPQLGDDFINLVVALNYLTFIGLVDCKRVEVDDNRVLPTSWSLTKNGELVREQIDIRFSTNQE